MCYNDCKTLYFVSENLALHQPAWQSSTAFPDNAADRAVDGTDRQCAASDGRQTAEWRVDLGAVKVIHHVFIQYATGNRIWGTVSFNVIHST